jgi:murein DD-endopeptidase MepM/ murein hydrolase activator NlpD
MASAGGCARERDNPIVESPARTLESRVAVRAAAAFMVLALVATMTALDVSRATAADLGSTRRGQGYWESAMLQADRLVGRLDRGHGAVRREVKRADRHLDRARSRRAFARTVVRNRMDRVRRLAAEVDKIKSKGEEVSDGLAGRLRHAENRVRRAQSYERRLDRLTIRYSRIKAAKQRRMATYRRALRGAIGRQRAAEGALGGLIASATRLAQQRAELKTAIRLGTEGSFVWPSLGRLTQGYGCTGYAANPRRGSCRHFHDGLDISPSAGTRIGTVATGVIAYAGWNPWDAEGRAFIVVVGHADGYVSRYGHLVPNRRVAVAGHVVYRGQTIGYMGTTGNSTGVHLHVEVLRGGSTVNPLALFPERGDAGKDKKKKIKNKNKGDKKAKAKAKSKRKSATAKHRGDRKGKRGNARSDRGRDERRERGRGEASTPTVEPEAGAAIDAAVALDSCEAPEAPVKSERTADAKSTLDDLAAQLRISLAACDAALIEPEDETSWPDGTSPWDLSVLDEPGGSSTT